MFCVLQGPLRQKLACTWVADGNGSKAMQQSTVAGDAGFSADTKYASCIDSCGLAWTFAVVLLCRGGLQQGTHAALTVGRCCCPVGVFTSCCADAATIY